MPRQSYHDKVLAEREQKLEAEVHRAAAEAERLAGELRLVRTLRKEFAATPKRSRAKGRTVTAPSAASAEQKATAA